ncbi:PAS domain-containing protein [Neorhodopirellula pilleata]|uniref:histidine kinase n=1 Tax=Neorhodopirellula pilleata TaxID=2714738 RepID=A0A5C6AHY5_9BACT|nr:PAS domain-containing protein [Neorhodopirellula pilleata]TWT98868.1 Aerobic respiration control sensor protein ArcB [Neorhodopirellula pilleata]
MKSNSTTNDTPFIVAVGASAGGLDAFTSFLDSLEPNLGVAIVFVQHLEANSKSLLASLLRSHTTMDVVEFDQPIRIRPDTIYLCPPQGLLEARDGFLVLVDDDVDGTVNERRKIAPIDHFFHSIASQEGERGIGIILSGAGSDGTLGLKSISDHGGMTFAQDAESAKFDSMPRNAATTGVADHVMPPAAIAEELVNYVKYMDHTSVKFRGKSLTESIEQAIPEIAERLLRETNHNFQHYKPTTLGRRIQRRMQVLKIARVSDYVDRIDEDPDEASNLFRELLIGVTAFFRDPDAFARLANEVIPKIFENRTGDDVVRIWVPGCATGEEAYSIAILCQEFLGEREQSFQVFASDIDERALGTARQGVYPIGIVDNVSEERLKRFFIKKGKRYHVVKEIRERVLFSPHNLISDPPFSRQDLISCRNLLIYLGPHLQKKLIPLFHYALRPNGYLFLGPSESMSSHGELFRNIDTKHRISQRKGTSIGRSSQVSFRSDVGGFTRSPGTSPLDDDKTDIVQIMQRIILDEFAPKSIVIDEDGQVICTSGETNKYLSTGEGAFRNNVVKMARRELRIGLRAAFAEAKSKRRRVTHENLSVQTDDGKQRVRLTVQPMMRLGEESGLFLVVFHDVGLPIPIGDDRLHDDNEAEASKALVTSTTKYETMIEHLERELATTRDDLERLMQEMETANEELKSSNEELLSMNEELQSANEELETSKEEIRATGEAVAQAHADLENLLRSTEIATVFLDDDLNIRSFTPAIADIYSLIPTDIGRPLQRFVPEVDDMPPLPSPQSIRDGDAIEHTVLARSGKSYIRRVLPYQSHTGKSEGIVVTFTDVSQIRESQELFELLVDASAQIVWITNAEGVVDSDSPSWRAFTGQTYEQWKGHGWLDAIHPDDREPTMTAWSNVLETGQRMLLDYRLRHHSGEYRWTRVRAVAQRNVDGSIKRWVGMNTDIDDQKRAEKALIESKDQLRIGVAVASLGLGRVDYQTDTIELTAQAAQIYGLGDTEMNINRRQLHSIFHPDDRDYIHHQIEACLDPDGDGLCDLDHRIVLPDGKVRWISARKQVYFDRSAQPAMPTHATLVTKDITYRKTSELELADREAHLRRVLDNTIAFIGVLETDGTLREANAPALDAADLKRDEVVGEKFWDLYWWSFSPRVQSQLQACVRRAAEGESVRQDLPYRSAGGNIRILDFMLNPVRDSTGNVTHLIPSAIDIHDRRQMQTELADAKARLELSLEVSGVATWNWNMETDDLISNPALNRMFGFDPNENLLLEDFLSQMDEPVRKRVIAAIEDAAENGGTYDEEYPIRLKNGEIRHVRAVGKVHKPREISNRDEIHQASDLQPPQFYGVVLDVTDRKEREMETARREANLRRVINNQLGLVGVIDRQGILLEVDDRSLAIAKTRREDVIGFHFADAPWWNYDPAVAQRMRESMQRAVAGEVVRYDVSLFSHTDEGVMIDFMIAPVFDEQGNVEYLIPSGVDIRERVKMEQEQRSVTRRLEMALRAGGMAAWEWTPTKSIWMPELYDLLGIDRTEEASTDRFFSLVHPDDIDKLKRAWNAAIEQSDLYDAEFRIFRPDGEVRWINGLGEVVRDQEGRVVRMYGVNWDSTHEHLHAEALRQSERQAQLANASKSEFLANMSHEIRTPMTAILGYADLLREYVKDEDATKYLNTIRRNGDYLLDIINDILDLSKIEAGKFEIDRERFEPRRVIEDVHSIMGVRATESNLELTIQYDGKLPRMIEADAKRLKQILINLVGNAIKFTRKGRVNIRVHYHDGMLHFDVIDTGIGMSEEQQQRLFQPFSQGDASVTRTFGGTGLGLAISRRLAEMLGGRILVSSTENVGSTFTVSIATGNIDEETLIEYIAEPLPALSEAPPAGSPVDRLNCHVLIVDDRRDIRFLSKRILNQAGASVDECEDGQLAVEYIADCLGQPNCPDLVILDMQMPNLDGYQTARKLRDLGYTAPIIALTADAMQGDMSKCLESGCNDYLSKPIDKRVMLQKVFEMLGQFP